MDQVSQVKHWKNECEKQQKLRFKVGCKPIRKKQLRGLVLVVSVCSTRRKALNWLEKTSEHLLERWGLKAWPKPPEKRRLSAQNITWPRPSAKQWKSWKNQAVETECPGNRMDGFESFGPEIAHSGSMPSHKQPGSKRFYCYADWMIVPKENLPKWEAQPR